MSNSSCIQLALSFPDVGVETGDVLYREANPVPPPADAGTACERAIAEMFGWQVGVKLPGKRIVETLEKQGHAPSTIGRAFQRLGEHGTILRRERNDYQLTSALLPPVAKNASRPGKAPNRFGKADTTGMSAADAEKAVRHTAEREAKYVREFLIDRLDEVIACPNAYLAKVLRAVEWAGRAVVALKAKDADGVRRATEEYEALAGKENLSAANLMEALQVGLFIEEFDEDEEVEAEKQRRVAEMKRVRLAQIADAVKRNQEIAEDNEVRAKAGLEPLPLIDCSDEGTLSVKEFANGLVPRGGGERVGSARLIEFLKEVGATDEAAAVEARLAG